MAQPTKRHKHADLIIAWANGAQIQGRNAEGTWDDLHRPHWIESNTYRIKSERVVRYAPVWYGTACYASMEDLHSALRNSFNYNGAVRLEFDPDTHKLVAAEPVK